MGYRTKTPPTTIRKEFAMPRLKRFAFIGIDPGNSGGIVCLTRYGSVREVDWMAMPDNYVEIVDFIQKIRDEHDIVYAAIEKVASSPQMGVASAFTFGMGYGALVMALVALGIPFEQVRPQVWQKEFAISTRKKEGGKTEFKKHLRNIARQMYPNLDVWRETQTKQLAIADALLIATYAKKVNE